ncbi:MAG: DNA translocase FtsK [Clostridiales bacterium]|nr:DNA translocase FtsK [Clostridiales bacterium]
MPSTGTKKTTGTSKRKRKPAASAGRKSSGRKRSSTQKKQQSGSGLGLEIMILIVLAVSILLLISNFGLGGSVGKAVSEVFFGMMGWISYLFPLVLFVGTAFVAVNRRNRLIKKKTIGLAGAFLCLNGLIHLFTLGYAKGDTLAGYYEYCSLQKTGGGVIGGGLAKLLCMAFGTLGAYVVLLIALLISVIILTQRPVLAPLKKKSEKVYHEVRENHLQRKERRSRIAFEQMKLPVEGTEPTVSDKSVKKERKKEKEQKEDMTPMMPDFQLQQPDQGELFQEDIPPFDMQELTPVAEDSLEQDIRDSSWQDKAFENEPEPVKEEPIGREHKKNPKSSPKEIADGVEHIQNEITEKEIQQQRQYVFPPIDLLKRGNRKASGDSSRHLRETAMKLQTTLHNFGVNVTVTNVSCGPTVTRYELQPEQGVKVSKIVSLTDDIKLNLAAADIRIEAPIPGKAAVGIEVPNETNSAVMLRDLLESKEFQEFPSELAFAVGKDIAGKTVVADIGKMPHLLIAGATGSGKSVCINTLIMSIIYKASPEDVKLIMIDPKVVELSVYNGIPHLFIPVVTDPKKAAGALNWAVAEMTERYNKFAEYNVRDLKGYNEKIEQIKDIDDENKPKKLPKIVIIVDELADLMMVAPGEVEDAICRLAQLARAAGLHLIIATQRPSVNVITGLIKANMPSRIAFSVSSGVDSRTILDMNGAEKLLGKGDMLYYPQGYQKPGRLQGSFVSDTEVAKVVDFLTENHQAKAEYDTKITDMMNSGSVSSGQSGSGEEVDVHFADAGKFIIEKDKASIGMLQRMFKIGFNRAARIMDQLAEAGVVGPEEGTKPRKVLMSLEEFENYIEESL